MAQQFNTTELDFLQIKKNLISYFKRQGGQFRDYDFTGSGMDQLDSYTLPAPNLMLSALDRLAQKIGKVPTLDVHITNARDSQRNKSKKDKLE